MTSAKSEVTTPITSLRQLNKATIEDAKAWFLNTCSSENWCEKMVLARPFTSVAYLIAQAKQNWQQMQTPDLMEAFRGHPMIGDINTLRAKYAQTKSLASNEQSGTLGASEETLAQLHAGNKAYLNKHGFIFIIFATGLSAQTMLKALNTRLNNSTEDEIKNAAQEQIKISVHRINKALGEA